MGATAKIADFTNVKEGGGRFTKKRVKAGDYAAKIVKVEDAEVKATKEFQYLFTIQLQKHPSATYPYYCQLTEKTLWKLRNLFLAAGMSVPKKKQKVDPNRLVGKIIGVTMDDTEYDDKEQSQVDAVFPAADLGEGEDEEAGDDYDENDGDDDEDDEEDVESDTEEEEVEDEEEEAEEEGDEWDAITDRLELRKALKKVAPDVKTSSSQTENDIRDLIRAAIAGDDEEEEVEEDEEEEPEPPKKKPAAKAAAPAKKTKKKSSDVSDEELEELDIDDL